VRIANKSKDSLAESQSRAVSKTDTKLFRAQARLPIAADAIDRWKIILFLF
jgi:hypothetical protein